MLNFRGNITPGVFLACLYKSTGRAIAVTTVWALKFLVKVCKSMYLLNPRMDLVDTLPDVRYWSEVLCCTRSRTLKL